MLSPKHPKILHLKKQSFSAITNSSICRLIVGTVQKPVPSYVLRMRSVSTRPHCWSRSSMTMTMRVMRNRSSTRGREWCRCFKKKLRITKTSAKYDSALISSRWLPFRCVFHVGCWYLFNYCRQDWVSLASLAHQQLLIPRSLEAQSVLFYRIRRL